MKMKRLVVKKSNITYFLNYSDIIFFENCDRRVNVVLKNDTISFYDSFINLRNRICNYIFLQCHRSYIVNPYYIYSIENDEVSFVNTEKKAYIGDKYKEEFFSELSKII